MSENPTLRQRAEAAYEQSQVAQATQDAAMRERRVTALRDRMAALLPGMWNGYSDMAWSVPDHGAEFPVVTIEGFMFSAEHAMGLRASVMHECGHDSQWFTILEAEDVVGTLGNLMPLESRPCQGCAADRLIAERDAHGAALDKRLADAVRQIVRDEVVPF